MSHGIFLARVAGLPADTLGLAAWERLSPLLARQGEAERQLTEHRAALVDALFARVPQAEPELRPFLLSVKRRAFNGRPLAALLGDPRWPAADRLAGGRGEALARLEDELSRLEGELASVYQEERAYEGEELLRRLAEPEVQKAVTLASRDLIASAARLGGESPESRRKQARTEVSTLRYLTRAAYKLSPFATLTRIALGEVRELGPGPALRLGERERWQESSLVRARRDLVEGMAALLVRHPAILPRLPVRLNDTLKEDSPGLFRLLRPLQYARAGSSEDFQWTNASFVKVRLDGPVPRFLLSELAGRSFSFGDLVAALSAELVPEGDEESATALADILEQLLSIGFLQLEAPWPSHTIHLEKTLLDYLRGLPEAGELQPAVEGLTRLLQEEEAYAGAADPAQAILSLDRTARELSDTLAEICGGIHPLPREVEAKYYFYQDVFVTEAPARAGEAEGSATLALSREAAHEILDSADLLWRFANFRHPSWSFQHALSALVAERWPGLVHGAGGAGGTGGAGGSIDFLDVFGEARKLWQDYVKWLAAPAGPSYNPFDLPAVHRLEELRRDLHAGIREAMAGETSVPVDRLRPLAALIPEAYDPLVGPCVYVQPADAAGKLWALNRLFEGTGRFGSRFTVAMPPATRGRHVEAFTAASRFTAAGETPETIELLDVLYAHENTVNLHAPQTPRVLVIPGEQSDLPRERQVLLSELCLSFEGESRLPVVRDRSGQRYLPCHMTPANNMHMPVLAKFLAALGPSSGLVEMIPGDLGVVIEGEMIRLERVTVGSLVFRRRRWVFPSRLLPGSGGHASGAAAFQALHRWFEAQALPLVFYAIERVSPPDSKSERYKPQFIDLRSPAMAELFAGIALRQDEMTIEEALPAPADFPADPSGRSFGVELMLDGLVMERKVVEALAGR